MPPRKAKTYEGRVYLGVDDDGRERYKWVGRFATRRERDDAVALARIGFREAEAREQLPAGEQVTVAEYADRVLDRKRDGRLLTKQGRRFKRSSLDVWDAGLRGVKAEFGDRPLAAVSRSEAVVWAESQSSGVVAVAVGLFGLAVDEEILDRNPFRGLVRKGRGRADDNPPTPDEFDRLLAACDALGDYADQMRALMIVGAYTGMRPGELFALEWGDIDLAAHRIHVRRRVYKGELDLPKSNRERTIALPPPARDALLRQPTRALPIVFASKTGRRLSQPTLTGYWQQVRARAGLDFEFYVVTKHLAVHRLYGLGLSARAIATQMGWSESAVDHLLAVYGHKELVALAEIDALYDTSDAIPTQTPGDPAA